MNFVVNVPDSVVEKINGWNLPPQDCLTILSSLRKHIGTLPSDQLGRRIVAPVRCVVVSVASHISIGPVRVVAWVRDVEDPVRYVLDVSYEGVRHLDA